MAATPTDADVERANGVRGQEVAVAFELYLRRQGRSEATRAKYMPVVRDLIAWASPRYVGSLTAGDLDRFLAASGRRRSNASAVEP